MEREKSQIVYRDREAEKSAILFNPVVGCVRFATIPKSRACFLVLLTLPTCASIINLESFRKYYKRDRETGRQRYRETADREGPGP